MTTLQGRFAAALDWARHEFLRLSPVTQADPFTAPVAIVDRAIAAGWNGAALEAIRRFAMERSRSLLEVKREKRADWSEEDRRDWQDELAELKAARLESIHDGTDAWF